MLTSLYDENIPTGHNGTFQRDTNNKYIYVIMIVPKLWCVNVSKYLANQKKTLFKTFDIPTRQVSADLSFTRPSLFDLMQHLVG